MAAQGEFLTLCQVCGCEFIAKAKHAKYCPNCRKEQQYQQNKNNSKLNYIRKKIEVANPIARKSINDLMWDLKAFNEKHNSNYSYGEYVSYLEGGLKL